MCEQMYRLVWRTFAAYYTPAALRPPSVWTYLKPDTRGYLKKANLKKTSAADFRSWPTTINNSGNGRSPGSWHAPVKPEFSLFSYQGQVTSVSKHVRNQTRRRFFSVS